MNAPREILFFDGNCGLCHGLVRFVVGHDHAHKFAYAPLQGDTFRSLLAPNLRSALPDSVVIKTADGDLLLQSSAVVHVLEQLGGVWHRSTQILKLIPRPWRDFGYAFIARMRHRLFAAPESQCPISSTDTQSLFLP